VVWERIGREPRGVRQLESRMTGTPIEQTAMGAGGTGTRGGASTVIRLLAIRDEPLSVDEVLTAVADPAAGGVALFVGTVRDHDAGREVTRLGYSAHPSAAEHLRAVAEKVAADFPVRAIAAVHRTGDLAVGDLAVVVAVACPHRSEAFAACHRLIDDLKETVPIWKHQRFADGTDEWVGSA
jgi:molybdopterin synthase catalytic subunit